MDWINYHHLLYFWTVARTGSIAKASKELDLAQPTISAQIKTLEESLGEKLFDRAGRGLVLTETGHMVYAYAEEIFSIGRELMDTIRQRPTGKPLRLRVGVADVLPKVMSRSFIEVALRQEQHMHLVCRQDRAESLEASLASYGLDLVIADAPLSPRVKVRAYSEKLGDFTLSLFGTPDLASLYRPAFPKSLQGAPLLMPTSTNQQRRHLEQWFRDQHLNPRIVAEFDDSALMKAFAQSGHGLFPAPTAIKNDLQKQYGVESIGVISGIKEEVYAISVERKQTHPGVIAICQAARAVLDSDMGDATEAAA